MTSSNMQHEAGKPTRADGDFFNSICAYFRDFLDTDFRKQRLPKRSIGLRDQRGNLTSISVAKYPSLVNEIWKVLSITGDSSKSFTLSIPREKYRTKINRTLLDLVEKHVAATKQETLAQLGDRAKANARELRQHLSNDPERYAEAVLNTLRGDLVRTTTSPLLKALESSFERQGQDSYELSYNIEDELGARLVSGSEEAISSAVATAIIEDNFDELDAVIVEIVDVENVRRRLLTYFETFRSVDFFQELHELHSTLKLRENFDLYLYVGCVQHLRISYPLFYLPLSVTLEERVFRISADRQLFINKKAIEYAAQEAAREVDHPIPIAIRNRIVFLEDGQSYVSKMQELTDRWTSDLALKPALDLLSPVEQRAQRSQLAISNGLFVSAFDKADESVINDYEELMALLASTTSEALDFRAIINDFLKHNPIDVTSDVDREWDGTPIEHRLVFESPISLNEEQRKILKALNHDEARFLSIEGPPGTGKSHTIAAIVFDAILTGKNVLVLSDKTEALDVVENKLNEVLDGVRFSVDFQNPILRLGRSGNTYGRILTSQSINSIRAHLKASTSRQPELVRQLDTEKHKLSTDIKTSTTYCDNIRLTEVQSHLKHEALLTATIPDFEAIRCHSDASHTLEAVAQVGALLSANGGIVEKVLWGARQRQSLDDLALLMNAQSAFGKVGTISSDDAAKIRQFVNLKFEHVRQLRNLISDLQSARVPLFGWLFSGSKIRDLNSRAAKQLPLVDALNVHKRLRQLEECHGVLSQLVAELTRSGLHEGHLDLVFQQIIEGLAPFPMLFMRSQLVEIHGLIDTLEKNVDLKKLLKLDPQHIEQWVPTSQDARLIPLQEMITYFRNEKRLQSLFSGMPTSNYAGDKGRLESLHAQRMAHALDSSVIDFADKSKNDAQAIRDIIRKKQKFPREKFSALKRAFPVIIAGVRDYADYIPLEKDLFDIVIIDEASQVSIAQAFPAFIRAKKLVVLGDQKQFSNVKTATASIEINSQYASEIIREYQREQEINVDTLNRLKLFNIKTSVLDFVERIANAKISLRKHFRGYPELISFSSKYFYKGTLQAVKIRGIPIDEVIKFTAVASDGRSDVHKNTNSLEYKAILEELRQLAECEPCPSVGVITPFTEQQSFIVQHIGAEKDSDELQILLNLKVMTFDSCQGEERDIIIYSMVSTPAHDRLPYIFPKSLDEADEVDHSLRLQRLNVGFSRAKERLHVFHTIPLVDIRGGIGKALRHYVRELERAHTATTTGDTDPTSPMEAKVLEWLRQTPFYENFAEVLEINAQFELGEYLKQLDPTYRHPLYRVDFLLQLQAPQGAIPIVIEYDGFKEHFVDREKVHAHNYDEYMRPDDVERQKILEGYGYHFLRINRFNLGRDPVQTLNTRLWQLCQSVWSSTANHVLVDELKDTAEALKTGTKKICYSCNEVRTLEDFDDPKAVSGKSRKCSTCKQLEAKGQLHSPRSTRGSRRRWRR